MKNSWKIIIIVVLIAAVAIAVGLKGKNSKSSESASAAKQISKTSDKASSGDVAASEPKSEVKSGDICDVTLPTSDEPTTEKKPTANDKKVVTSAQDKPADAKPKPAEDAPKMLPKLLDLGATSCVPCKMMVPVLDELTKEYKGKLEVEFIDVWEDKSAAEKYGVQTIPTQIFFDTNGKEFYRHTGFFPKADILKVFKDHGIKLTK